MGLGIAVLGSIGTAIYRRELSEAIPVGMPQQALDTRGGAVYVTSQISGNSGAMLLDAARQAFIQALHLSILVSVVLSSVAAIMIFATLRNMQNCHPDEANPRASEGIT